MLTNKWMQFGLNIIIAIMGTIAAFDWTSVVSASTAATIATVIALGKAVMNTLLPSAGQTITPTGGTIVTHN
jgi:hypothetical protein